MFSKQLFISKIPRQHKTSKGRPGYVLGTQDVFRVSFEDLCSLDTLLHCYKISIVLLGRKESKFVLYELKEQS